MATANQNSSMYRLTVDQPKEKGEHAPHDVVLSFDTTVSMAPFIQKLRVDLQQFITNIFSQHPQTRIAVRTRKLLLYTVTNYISYIHVQSQKILSKSHQMTNQVGAGCQSTLY